MSNVAGLQRSQTLEALARTEGSQILEIAVSLPLIMVIVVGLMDFSAAFILKYKLNNAAREGARFASSQSTADLTNPTPSSITGVRDFIDNNLVDKGIKDCGLSTAAPTQSGLAWTYTANTGCPGSGTLTLIIDRGSTFPTTGASPVRIEATRVNISYPYQWRFNSVIQLLVPGGWSTGITQISTGAVMQNLN
jgi:Flp pilus assembly protein TadG